MQSAPGKDMKMRGSKQNPLEHISIHRPVTVPPKVNYNLHQLQSTSTIMASILKEDHRAAINIGPINRAKSEKPTGDTIIDPTLGTTARDDAAHGEPEWNPERGACTCLNRQELQQLISIREGADVRENCLQRKVSTVLTYQNSIS